MEFKSALFFVTLKLLLLHISYISGDLLVEKVAEPVVHGEGPHWDADKQVLYYVDISNQSISKYDPKSGSIYRVYIDGGPVGFVIPDMHDRSKFILGRGLDVLSMIWDEKSTTPSNTSVLVSVDQDKPQNRFNDGKADASGRLWAGTMGPENPVLRPNQGTLFSFEWPDEFKPHKHLFPVSISNGLAWNNNNDLMYYIDSLTRVVHVFDFDITKGEISNKRDLFSLEKNNITGFPDGMTIDRNENLWVAIFGGGSVLHIDTKNGKLLNKIDFPVKQVTSCAFGGKDLQNLYVTTSRVNLNKDELAKQPLAGALFVVKGLDVPGQIKSNKIITLS